MKIEHTLFDFHGTENPAPENIGRFITPEKPIFSGFPINPRPQLFQRRLEFFDQPVAIFLDPPGDVLGRDAAGDVLRAPARQLQQCRDQVFSP